MRREQLLFSADYFKMSSGVKRKRTKLQCEQCEKTFDDDYRKQHEEKYHNGKRMHVKTVGAPSSPFAIFSKTSVKAVAEPLSVRNNIASSSIPCASANIDSSSIPCASVNIDMSCMTSLPCTSESEEDDSQDLASECTDHPEGDVLGILNEDNQQSNKDNSAIERRIPSRPTGATDVSATPEDKPTQPRNILFPSRDICHTQRRFNPRWYEQYSWLEYSI